MGVMPEPPAASIGDAAAAAAVAAATVTAGVPPEAIPHLPHAALLRWPDRPYTVRNVVSPTLCPPRSTAPYPACLAGTRLPLLHVLRPLVADPATEPDLAACLAAETASAPPHPVPGFPHLAVVEEGMYSLSARFSAALRTYPALTANQSAAALTILAYPFMLTKFCVHVRGVPWPQAATSMARGVGALARSLGFDGTTVSRPAPHALLLDALEWKVPPAGAGSTQVAVLRYDLHPALRVHVTAGCKERFNPRGYPSDVLALPFVSAVRRRAPGGGWRAPWEGGGHPRPTLVAYVGSLDHRVYAGVPCVFDAATDMWAPFHSGGCLRDALRPALTAAIDADDNGDGAGAAADGGAGGSNPPGINQTVEVSALTARGASFTAPAAAALMLRARYCLQPAGDGQSRKGAWDALLLGCIPVLFRPNLAVQPFEGNIPYADFTVTIPEADVIAGRVDVVATLRAIPPARYGRMVAAARVWAPRLAYVEGGRGGGGWDPASPDAYTAGVLALAGARGAGTYTRADVQELYGPHEMDDIAWT